MAPHEARQSVIERLLAASAGSVRGRVWIISDLQILGEYEDFVTTAVEDFRSLELACDAVWYLGDAVASGGPDDMAAMARFQIDALRGLGLPVRYVIGNHDFDYSLSPRTPEPLALPFYDLFKSVPGWRTTASIEDFYFTEELGEFLVVFLSDHADREGRWVCTQGKVHRDAASYPHGPGAYAALRRRMAECGRPVITAGHYAFTGGSRPSPMLDRLLPLPESVRLHVHGHQHVGDASVRDPDFQRKISTVTRQKVPQINVSAIERRRADQVRSVVLEVHADRTLGVFFRDHDRRAWAECYVLDEGR